MFYRIFYTSWPQLLEAGRGGFGIVARHREIPTVISHAAEAASQFAPLRGEAVHRVVCAYRTETAQSGRWHILSRIEDSGSDYTGRTNYLAQHLVANDQVARSLASQGISPAMVMGAPDAWPGFDRQVGFITDPPWQVGQAPTREGYWAGFGDGNADRRFLLAAGSNVTFVYPPHWQNSGAAGFILGLYDEAACGSRADCGWGTTFATYLEPTDKPQDFCWIGLPADSALLPKLRDTGRAIITETTPPPARPVAAVISPSNKGPVSLPVGEGGAGTNPSSAAALQRQRSSGSLRGGGPPQPTNPPNTKTAPLTSSEPSWLKRVWGQHKLRLCAGAAGVCIAVIAWWLISSAMSSSQPHSSEPLKVTYGEFNSETVRRILEERRVPRDAELQFSEAAQEQWRSQLPQDAGSYEIRRIIKPWLPILPNKEEKLPYSLIIAKKTPVIEFERLSFDDDGELKEVSPKITPEEAPANLSIKYKRLDESDNTWSTNKTFMPGDHQAKVVILATRNFDGVTNIVDFTINQRPPNEGGQDKPNNGKQQDKVTVAGSVESGNIKKEIYLALSPDALKEAKRANIWPADDPQFERQDWKQKSSKPEQIQKDGSLGTNSMTTIYEMEGQLPVGLHTPDPDATFKHMARSPSKEVHLIGLPEPSAAGDLSRGGTNLPEIDPRAIEDLAEPKVEVTKTLDGKALELSGLDESFKKARLLPKGAMWILRIDLSQFGKSDPVDLNADTPGTFILEKKLRQFEQQKTSAEVRLNQAAELNKKAADEGGFLETNKKLIVDEFNILDEKFKLAADSLIKNLDKIAAPPKKDDKALSDVENLKELLINVLECADNDQNVGGWMKLSPKSGTGNQGTSGPGDPWLKNFSDFQSLQPRQLRDWLELHPAKGANVAALKEIAEKWLDHRLKNLTEPAGNSGVKKEDVKQVLNALKHGIRKTGVSGQDGATASPTADVDSARREKTEAEEAIAFLDSLGTSRASGSAQLLIKFPPVKGPDGKPLDRQFILLPDVALKPGARNP